MAVTIVVQTTYRHEANLLATCSLPTILASILQYSIPLVSVLTVGHLGKIELGAVSLGSMTVNITGYAVYQGIATCLDTLCAQAYGSGHHQLVGVHCQKVVYLLWGLTIPIGVLWLFSYQILSAIIPGKEIIQLAATYLRILLLGAPGWAAFESGKRFVQAQGLFRANLYVLLVLAPLNAFLHWLFVWKFAWGFVGAPLAVAVTNDLLPIGLFIYVRFVSGMRCWGGFTSAAFKDWSPIINLAIPGFLMVEAEWMAFEILTLSASYLGPTQLAAQSVLITMATLGSQIPVPLSIVASTRVANLIGAGSSSSARVSATVSIITAILLGTLSTLIFIACKTQIAFLFTNDLEVAGLIINILPVIAGFQICDATSNMCNGLLRGIGRQDISGYVGLFCFYAIGLPIAFITGFRAHWGLWGLWIGPSFAALLIASLEGLFLISTDWKRAIEEAKTRTSLLNPGQQVTYQSIAE